MENDPRVTLPGGWLARRPAPRQQRRPSRCPPPRPRAQTRAQRRPAPAGPTAVRAAAGLKFGKVALLFVGKAKVLTTSASMLVAIAAYTFIFGFWFAVGFVVLLLIHEMGHRLPAAAGGDRGQRADVHPVPRRS
jgi:hypothetical protein